MAYTVRITRRGGDLEPVTNDLTLNEWSMFAVSDPAVCFVGDTLDVSLPSGRTMSVRSPNGFWALATPQGDVTLTFDEGSVSAELRSRDAIATLVGVAHGLGARLVGEDGAVYT